MRRVLGIQVVALAALAAIMRVGCGDLEHLDAGVLQVAQQPGTVGARRLDANTLERPKGAHPGKHLLIAVPGGREGLAGQHPILLVDHGRDVKVLVRIDATHDVAVLFLSILFHAHFSGFDGVRTAPPGPDAWTGQSRDRTSGPSWVTCTHRTEGFALSSDPEFAAKVRDIIGL